MLILLKKWLKKRNSLHHLNHLDDRLLRDIGLSRESVAEMSKKPFWKY